MAAFVETQKNIEKMIEEIENYYDEAGELHLDQIEKIIILFAAKIYNTKEEAAKKLNISIRTIRNKLNEYKNAEEISEN